MAIDARVKWSGLGTFVFPNGGGFQGSLITFPAQSLSSTPVIFVTLQVIGQGGITTKSTVLLTFANATTLTITDTSGLTYPGQLFFVSDSRLALGGTIGATLPAYTSQGPGSIAATIVDGNWVGAPGPAISLAAGDAGLQGSVSTHLSVGPVAHTNDLVIAMGGTQRTNNNSATSMGTTLPTSAWAVLQNHTSGAVNAGGFTTKTGVAIFSYTAEPTLTDATLFATSGSEPLYLEPYVISNANLPATTKSQAWAAVIGD